ncbi:leader peptide SpeFL [Avibacterium avium]|uniref:leader peptide SpeFL n=1 Tax=Avibacterium avium TaxID=751 RepID=UPI003BF8BB06
MLSKENYKPKYHIDYNPGKGVSLMAHIRRTRHIMMPSHRSCFSYSLFATQSSSSNYFS